MEDEIIPPGVLQVDSIGPQEEIIPPGVGVDGYLSRTKAPTKKTSPA